MNQKFYHRIDQIITVALARSLTVNTVSLELTRPDLLGVR